MVDGRRIFDATVGLRLRRLFGTNGLVQRLMVALDRRTSSVEDICAGRNIPPEVIFIIECLEQSPLWAWPDRFSDARSADAEAHKIKRGKKRLKYEWSDAELAPAAEALNNGETRKDAGAIIGLSYAAVSQLVYRGRLPKLRAKRGPQSSLTPDQRSEKIRTYQREYKRKHRKS